MPSSPRSPSWARRQPPGTGPTSGRSAAAQGLRVGLGLVGTVALLNVSILVASLVARRLVRHPPVPGSVSGLRNVAGVDRGVWRGGRPSDAEYRLLAEAGVQVVADLRAEDDAPESHAAARAAGLRVLHLPVRDGQTPSTAQIRRVLEVVAAAASPVYVHCGAGVGRTGAMAGAYLLRTGQASRAAAVARNLAVGPPSIEQLVFVGRGALEPPAWPVVVVSRVVDAPRRLRANLR